MKFIKKINKTNKIITIICLTLSILTITVITTPYQVEETSVESGGLSNEKTGWGIKKDNNHQQPDLGKTNKELIEKYNGLAMGNNEDKKIYLTFDLGYEAG